MPIRHDLQSGTQCGRMFITSEHIPLPLGGSQANTHDPDTDAGLSTLLNGARDVICENGGIAGQPSRCGDEDTEVITRPAVQTG